MKLRGPLAVLAKADGVSLGPAGFAAKVPKEATAYEEAGPIAADHVDELEWMVDHATPAGRWYAATLLAEVDSSRGEAAWERLVDSPGTFMRANGCTVMTISLDEAARGQLGLEPPKTPASQTVLPEEDVPTIWLPIFFIAVFVALSIWLVVRWLS